MNTKQVVVVRHDLKMRRGKAVAQGSHAAMAVVLNEMKYTPKYYFSGTYEAPATMTLIMDDVLEDYINGSFTKVVVMVHSEQELLEIHQKAKDAGLRTVLIKDSGKTEFHGVPTYTTCAIGPNHTEDIDPITGHLELY